MEQGEDMNSCSSVSGKKGGKRLVPQVEQRKDLIKLMTNTRDETDGN